MSAPGDPRAAVAGGVAIELARELAEPVRALRDRLGLVVDLIERHVATSTGPSPYPWRSLQALRQDLGGAYLEATALARRLDELDRALAARAPGAEGWFELPAAVELGLRLASHHLSGELELLIDLGNPPPVRGEPGMLALLVAQLAAACAGSVRRLAGSALSVRVGADGPWALVLVADNGAGSPLALPLGDLAREILAPWGATIEVASAEGQGCAFELRLATRA